MTSRKSQKIIKKNFEDSPKNEENNEKIKYNSSSSKKNKKIKKIKFKLGEKRRNIKEESSVSSETVQNSIICKTHKIAIEFLCCDKDCFVELCGYCILEHKEHIRSIKAIKDIISDSLKYAKEFLDNPQNLMDQITEKQQIHEKNLDSLMLKLLQIISKKIDSFKNSLNSHRNSSLELINDFKKFQTKNENSIMEIEKIDKEKIDLAKKFINKSNLMNFVNMNVNSCFLSSGIKQIIDQNIKLGFDDVILDSTQPCYSKLLHWFEWGKKKLNLYDIVQNTTRTIDLDIPFKIPSFSRSIILPNCKIYLLGGEEPVNFIIY